MGEVPKGVVAIWIGSDDEVLASASCFSNPSSLDADDFIELRRQSLEEVTRRAISKHATPELMACMGESILPAIRQRMFQIGHRVIFERIGFGEDGKADG